jgi:hypothetical protein
MSCNTVACQYPRFHSTGDYVRTRRRMRAAFPDALSGLYESAEME